MLWLEFVLKGVSVASTVIATLRAGSRIAYLTAHDAIGIMDGPLIVKGTNETNPMFELSEAFRHSVRLSFLPEYYEDARQEENAAISYATARTSEPYMLSARPYFEKNIPTASEKSEEEQQQHDVDPATDDEDTVITTTSTSTAETDEVIENPQKPRQPNFFQRQFAQARKNTAMVSKAFQYSAQQMTQTPRVAFNMARRAQHWRPWKRTDTQQIMEELLEESDWDYTMSTEAKLSFNSTEGIPRVAELSAYAPDCFADLRSSFGVSEQEYRTSIFGSGPFVSFQSNSKGAARVGGVFFFTRDGAYMIKTIKKEEAKTFLKMLPKYHRHMKRHARKSLLTRFCGMYGVRIHDKNSTDAGEVQIFTVMNAAFPAEGSRFISERYDLKGSTVGREVSEEELKSKGNNAVLKDLDLAREVDVVKSAGGNASPSDYGFSIGATRKAALLSQLREDVKLLVECQVMDYSLLVGVANVDSHTKIDDSARKALLAMQRQGRKIATSTRLDDQIVYAIGTPIRLLLSPAAFLCSSVWTMTQRTVSSIITLPLPYYGAGKCGVDGGLLSYIHGKRRNDRAVYYLGLIDFLQPWTTRKVLERKLKGLMGYDTSAISCVTPEEYAERFLLFLDAHIS